MSGGRRSILQIPLLLVVVADLAILGTRLWPWETTADLPGGAATAFDPAISLLAYLVLIFAITRSREGSRSAAQQAGGILGLLAGGLLAAQVVYESHTVAGSAKFDTIEMGMMAGAAILWGIAGVRGARAAKSIAMGFASGAWSAVVASLIAATAVIVLLYTAGPRPELADSWKDFEKIGLGDSVTATLVLSLNSATAYLLIGPIVGGFAGVLFAFFGQKPKP